jgi:hypothetical protein
MHEERGGGTLDCEKMAQVNWLARQDAFEGYRKNFYIERLDHFLTGEEIWE